MDETPPSGRSEPSEPALRPGYRLSFILDPDGLVRQVAEASGVRAWPQAGFVGRTLGDISAERAGPERGDLWDVRIARAQEATAPTLYLDRVPGAPITDPETVSSTVIPVRTAAGQLQAIVVEIEDRAEVGPREAQVRESERRFRELAESLPHMVWESDGGGNARYLSPKWETFSGVPVRDLLGRGYAELIHPGDRARLTAQREAGASSLVTALRLRRHDGEYRWMEAHIERIRDDDGVPVKTIGTIVDVTDRLAEEAARLRSQKREMVGTLLGGIGHDFNNVLSAIVSNAAMARREVSQGLSPDTSIAEIERGAARAADLVRRVLLQGRDDQRAPGPVDVGAVAHEACDLLRSALPRNVDLRVHVDDPLPPLHADATQLHQLVVNLVTNASQAIGAAPGTIEVRVTIDSGAPGGPPGTSLLLRVQDDGPGMDAAVRERVFDPYFTTKPAGEGTGLGLAAVHTIVRGHEGTVDLTSEPGRGATFCVRFPVSAAVSQDPAVPASGLTPGSLTDLDALKPGSLTDQDALKPGSLTDQDGLAADHPADPGTASEAGGAAESAELRVLFVDDEAALVQLAERALPADGLTPVGFTDPQDALTAFDAEPRRWAALVTDLSMPGLDGLTLAERMRSTRPDLPVVLTSGYLQPADRDRARDLGVDAIIPKPCSMSDLASAVRSAAD